MKLIQDTYQKTARDSLIIGVVRLLQFLIRLIRLPLLVKTLGVHDYGLWALVNVTIGLLLPFTNLGLSGAMMRFLAAEKKREEIQEGFYSVLSVLFIFNLIISLVIIIFAYPLAMNFFDGAVPVVRITAILVLLNPINLLYLALIRTFQQIKKYSIIVVSRKYGQIGLVALLVLNGYGILSVVFSVLVIEVIILLVLFFLIKSQIGIKIPRFSHLKEYLSYGLPLIPRGLSFWLVNLSDRYIVGFFLGITSVGIYSAAYRIASLPYLVVAILAFVLLVTLSKLYDEGRMSKVKIHLRYTMKYFLAIDIPFVFGVTILAEPILRLFTTPEIASQGRFVLPVIALAVSLLCIHNIVNNILILAKKTKIMAITWIVAAILNIGLNILLVPLIGIMGAAITTLIAYSLACCLISYYSFKEFKFVIEWHFIKKSLVSSAAMSLVVWRMAPRGNLDTILTVIVAMATYAIVLVLLKGFTKTEFEFFKGLLRRNTAGTLQNDIPNE